MNLRRLAWVGYSLLATGCGGSLTAGRHAPVSPPRASSTTSVSQDAVEVAPPAGPAGTVFQLRDAHFDVGQMVVVEIDRPDGQVFRGQGHTVTPDHMVKVTYRTSTVDPMGIYGVKFNGKGHADLGHFEVAARPSPTSAAKAPAKKR